ncbi:MAG: hypothetical protein ACR2PL_17120 [Dehalococcoidia bacterium]
MSHRSRVEELLHLPPRWVIPAALIIDAAISAWRSVSNQTAHQPAYFLIGLLWPGFVVVLVVYLFAWLGWALEID